MDFGIYHEDVMIGLVADDILHLKTGKSTKKYFINKQLPPFEYDKGEKKKQMSYYIAPEEIFDDPEQASYWANLANAAALRSKHKI
ncbi:MAG: DNA transformation protein [Gammaproteobacteria bacterium]